MIKNGDVLKTQSKPFIFHYGVYFIENGTSKIVHNSNTQGIIIQEWSDFFKDRKLIDIYTTNISGCDIDYIYKQYEFLKQKQFNITDYNCENFVSEFTFTQMKLPQWDKYKNLIIIGLLFKIGFDYINKK